MFRFLRRPTKPPLAKDLSIIEDSVDAIEEIIRKVKEDQPDDEFFAYVLTNSDSLASLGFHMNSYRNAKSTYDESIAKYPDLASPSLESHYRWAWVEWSTHECIGPQEAFRRLTTERLTPIVDAAYDNDTIEELGEEIIKAMHEIMRRLDERKCFGEGEAREKALIYLGFYDSARSIEISSAKALNPPKVWDAFKDDFESWL